MVRLTAGSRGLLCGRVSLPSKPGGVALKVKSDKAQEVEDPWEVLGLPRDANRIAVKTRFHQLVRFHHPDLGPEGSAYMLRRVVLAADSILDHCLKVPEPKRGEQASRYEKQKRQRERAAATASPEEVVLYVGHSRIRRGSWTDYKITMTRIVISWPLTGDARRPGSSNEKVVRFQDIRSISSRVELQDTRWDIMLELLWGAQIQLEQLPKEVAGQIEQFVSAARLRAQAKYETMLQHCV